MTDPRPCVPADRVHEWVDLPPTDPRAVHLDACPRCRSLLGAYADFLTEPKDAIPPAELEAADRSLHDFLQREVAGPPASSRSIPRPAAARPRQRWIWGVAAAAAVVLLVVVLRSPGLDERGSVLRGDTTSPSTEVRGLEASRLADGGWRLTWSVWPEADSYEVQVFTADLALLQTVVVTEPARDLRAQPDPDSGPEPRFWQVIARRAGDPLATSSLATLPRD